MLQTALSLRGHLLVLRANFSHGSSILFWGGALAIPYPVELGVDFLIEGASVVVLHTPFLGPLVGVDVSGKKKYIYI